MAMIEIYTKSDCCLCDDAKEVIYSLARQEDVDVKEVDIEKDSKLLERYGQQIPVVFVGGRKAFKFQVDGKKLERLVREAKIRD